MSERPNSLPGLNPPKRSSDTNASDRLESWKEIAAYLKRDLRTVQRWEKTEGLPVHRHRHDERASVFAFKSELDTWWHNEYLQLEIDEKSDSVPEPLPAATNRPDGLASHLWAFARNHWRPVVAVSAVVAVAVGAAVWSAYRRAAPALTDRDTVVIADFANSTGDPVFDGTLRQGLAVQLEQSPFLSLVSDERIHQTLRLMEKPQETKLTPEIARDLCQRVGSKAYIDGSIAKFDNDYVIGLSAVNCATGDSIAQEQSQAAGKEKILDALGRAARDLRRRLGESLSTLRRLDTPLYQATTPSLEALRAYSLAARAPATEALSLYQRAIDLDPNFAVAYDDLGLTLNNMGEDARGRDAIRKAFELRSRTSAIEQFNISEDYYSGVTGQIERAIQVAQLRAQLYPRAAAYGSLGADYMWLGQYEAAQSNNAREPCQDCSNVELTDLALNRFEDAKSVLIRERARVPYRGFFTSYELAFLRNDRATMNKELSSAHASGVDSEGMEDLAQADTELYYGHAKASRIFDRQAVDSVENSGRQGAAALWLLEQALREAEIGFFAQAIDDASAALNLDRSPEVRVTASLALARAGDDKRAESIAATVDTEFPSDSILRMYWSSTAKAAVALDRHNPERAVQLLDTASAVDLSGWTIFPNATTMYPVYVRGQAYLALHQGALAAAQFRNILNHRGLILNCPLGALAHLQLGRAYEVDARTARGEAKRAGLAKARASYQDFLTLWKDADPDIPILKQAKAEYAKLNQD